MTDEINVIETLGISEERFDKLFSNVNAVLENCRNSKEFLTALMTLPKNRVEGILVGSVFEKVQTKIRDSECPTVVEEKL